MRTQQTQFIADIDAAHRKIHELEALLGRRPSNLNEDGLYNIDTANEEIERLELELDKRLPKANRAAMALSVKQAAKQLEQTLRSQPAHGFKTGSGMARLAAAFERNSK
jgi:hypothetical protein